MRGGLLLLAAMAPLPPTLSPPAPDQLQSPRLPFRLAPAAPRSAQLYANDSMTTWGGQIIHAQGEWHLYVTAFTRGCGLWPCAHPTPRAHHPADSVGGLRAAAAG